MATKLRRRLGSSFSKFEEQTEEERKIIANRPDKPLKVEQSGGATKPKKQFNTDHGCFGVQPCSPQKGKLSSAVLNGDSRRFYSTGVDNINSKKCSSVRLAKYSIFCTLPCCSKGKNVLNKNFVIDCKPHRIKEKTVNFDHNQENWALSKCKYITKLWGFIPCPDWKWLTDPEYISHEKPKSKDTKSVHQVADSFFSSTSGFKDFSGFFNLCIIILVMSNARVALENLIKYGILVQPLQWFKVFIKEPYTWPSFTLWLLINVFIFITFWTERQLSKGNLSERAGLTIHIVNLATEILFPAAVVWERHPFPIFSSVCLAIYVVVFMKLISYVQVNGWCRVDAQRPHRRRLQRNKSMVAEIDIHESKPDDCEDDEGIINFIANGNIQVTDIPKLKKVNKYPKNLTLKDLYYFVLAPTLCYEIQFPKSARTRKRFLIKRIMEMLFLLGLILGLIQQWILPTVSNSMTPFQQMHFTRMLERLLKLSVPNLAIWLLFFYWFFHSCLNVMAEVLRFGDRTFYRDWWNAETVQYFWQNWNIPVHRWASRHLYKPLITHGFTSMQSSICVFMFSAFFHEYLVSIPLQMFKIWAFSAMISQVPMAIVIKKYFHGKYGNMVVWLSLIIGQPFAIMMYYHDYFILNHGKWGLS